MNRKTKDIRYGQKKILTPFTTRTKRKGNNNPRTVFQIGSGFRISSFKKRIDFQKQKRIRKRSPSQSVFFIIGIVLLSLIAIAGKNALAKKQEVEDIKDQMKIEFQSGIQQLTQQKFTESRKSFQNLENLSSTMRSVINPILMDVRYQQDSPDVFGTFLILSDTLAKIGQDISKMGPKILDIPNLLLEGNGEEVLPILRSLSADTQTIYTLLPNSKKVIEKIRSFPFLPKEIEDSINTIQPLLSETEKSVSLLREFFPAARALLGEQKVHTIAILFQNSGEIRATGGFPGSLAIISSDSGNIEAKFYDIYALSWKIKEEKPPPPGFERLTKKLTLQDANYSPNFPTSAKTIQEMLSKADIPMPDTILTITDDLLTEILKYVGGIPIPGTTATLTEKNTGTLLSFFVESKASGIHTPKETMKLLLPELVTRVKKLSPETLFHIVNSSIRKRWVLAYSTDPNVKKLITALGISGEIQQPNTEDYLAIFSANVGGNKSDRFLSEDIHIESAIDVNGAVVNTVHIKRSHLWGEEEDHYVDTLIQTYGHYNALPHLLKNILGAGENHSWTQVMTPKGSILLSATGIPEQGISRYQESGKSVFAFRFPKVAPGKSQSISLQYKLPRQLVFPGSFDLYYQVQPGRKSTHVTREILVESGIHLTNKSNIDAHLINDGVFQSQISQ